MSDELDAMSAWNSSTPLRASIFEALGGLTPAERIGVKKFLAWMDENYAGDRVVEGGVASLRSAVERMVVS